MKKIFFLFAIIVISIQNIVHADITTGLIAHFPFSGNTNDISGNSYSALTSGATLTTDRYGVANSAYAFETGQFIQTNVDGAKITSNTMSVAFWMKSNNQGDRGPVSGCDTAVLFSTFDISGNGYGFNYCRDQVGIWYLDKEGSTSLLTYNEIIYDDIWHLIVVVYDGNSSAIWRDGIKMVENNDTGSFAFQGDVFKFGKSRPTNFPWYVGVMDEVRIYNRALTSSDINELYTLEKPTGYDLNSDCNKDGSNNVLDVICLINLVFSSN